MNNPLNRLDPSGNLDFDFHYHGNWGGPDYTAGGWKSESDLSPSDFYIKAVDSRDACYRDHDISIYYCHQGHGSKAQMYSGETWCPNEGELSNCKEKANHKLANCLLRIPTWEVCHWMTDQGYIIKTDLEALIGFHIIVSIFIH